MEMRFGQILAILTAGAALAGAEGPDLVGTWRGDSLCAAGAASACNDEHVVYYIKHASGKSDTVIIQADKIVNGKAVTMGTGEWHYDRAAGTLEWKMPQRVWLLKITGSRIEGTLKGTDGTVLRNMTLAKDR
jgi:hypothetical protein